MQISETIAGEGFVGLAQSLITLGVKYGQVSAKDVLPHPTTVSRKITDVAAKVKQETVMPEIQNCLNKWGGGNDRHVDRVVQASQLHHCDGPLYYRRMEACGESDRNSSILICATRLQT